MKYLIIHEHQFDKVSTDFIICERKELTKYLIILRDKHLQVIQVLPLEETI